VHRLRGAAEQQYKNSTKMSLRSVSIFGSLFFERVRFGLTVASINMQVNFDKDDLYTCCACISTLMSGAIFG
jgi:hypothetical protein